MLEEAGEFIRLLWEGDIKDFEGRNYAVENARIYTVPDEPLLILISGLWPKAARLAGKVGDRYTNVLPPPPSCWASSALLRRRGQAGPRHRQGLLRRRRG